MTAQRQQLDINFAPIFDALERPLALISEAEQRSKMEAFIANARVHQEKAILEAFSGLLEAFNETGSGVRASLEMQGGGYAVNFAPDSSEPEPTFDASEEVERVTLRLPKPLKDRADEIAAQSGLSTNSWYIRTLYRALAHQMRHADPEGFRGGGGWGPLGRGRRRGGRSGGGGPASADFPRGAGASDDVRDDARRRGFTDYPNPAG